MKQLVLIAVLALGTIIARAEGPIKPAQQPAPAAHSGRYQIFSNPNVRADTFLVDTETGKIWQMVQYTNLTGTPTVWQNMTRIDDQEGYLTWLATRSITQNK